MHEVLHKYVTPYIAVVATLLYHGRASGQRSTSGTRWRHSAVGVEGLAYVSQVTEL